MTDLISRQAAIKAFGERPLVWDEWTDEFAVGLRNQYDHDVAAIKLLPSAQQWIPCSERLPEGDHHVVLICRKNGSVGEGCYHGIIGEWSQFRWNINGIKDVVAWMPLPKPYKEESDE